MKYNSPMKPIKEKAQANRDQRFGADKVDRTLLNRVPEGFAEALGIGPTRAEVAEKREDKHGSTRPDQQPTERDGVEA